MRENIGLYRGLRRDGDGWVEGFLVVCDQRCFIVPINQIQSWSSDWLRKNEYLFGRFFEVFPETIGQYACQTETNGKKVYEGDILENLLEGKRGIVRFGSYRVNAIGFYIKMIDDDECPRQGLGGWVSFAGKIIGNVHDNPELLETAEKEGAE